MNKILTCIKPIGTCLDFITPFCVNGSMDNNVPGKQANLSPCLKHRAIR